MQPESPRDVAPSRLARICMRLAGLPMGGFAAPPPQMMQATRDVDAEPQPAAVRPPRPEGRGPIRWTSLSAVR